VDENLAIELKEPTHAAELWVGLLLGPILALTQLEANYALVRWACGRGQDWPLHLVSALALTLTIGAALLAFRNLLRTDSEASGADIGGAGVVPRSRFMALLGILISSFMCLVIVAQWIPVFLYGSCQR
jgi:hypothetical protein